MSKPTLTLRLAKSELSLPLKSALWMVWRIATYPLTLAAGYYFFGIEGLSFCAILMLLNNRGEL